MGFDMLALRSVKEFETDTKITGHLVSYTHWVQCFLLPPC